MGWHILSMLAQLFGTLAAITRLWEFLSSRVSKKIIDTTCVLTYKHKNLETLVFA